MTEESWFDSQQSQIFFSAPKHTNQFGCPPGLLFSRSWGMIPGGKLARLKLTNHSLPSGTEVKNG
jgi:hypothetical protein